VAEQEPKWQPVLMILRNGGRLECECGALAVVVIGDLNKEACEIVEEVNYWCQSCWRRAQGEDTEE
jgi:hypothetical protein